MKSILTVIFAFFVINCSYVHESYPFKADVFPNVVIATSKNQKTLTSLHDFKGKDYDLILTKHPANHGHYEWMFGLVEKQSTALKPLWSLWVDQDAESGGCGGSKVRSRTLGLEKALTHHKIVDMKTSKLLILTFMDCETRKLEEQKISFEPGNNSILIRNICNRQKAIPGKADTNTQEPSLDMQFAPKTVGVGEADLTCPTFSKKITDWDHHSKVFIANGVVEKITPNPFANYCDLEFRVQKPIKGEVFNLIRLRVQYPEEYLLDDEVMAEDHKNCVFNPGEKWKLYFWKAEMAPPGLEWITSWACAPSKQVR